MLKTAWISKLCCYRIIAFLWCCYSVIGIFSVIYSKWSRLRLIILWVSTLSIYSKVILLTHRMDVFYALTNAETLKWSTWILIEKNADVWTPLWILWYFRKIRLKQIALLNYSDTIPSSRALFMEFINRLMNDAYWIEFWKQMHLCPTLTTSH